MAAQNEFSEGSEDSQGHACWTTRSASCWGNCWTACTSGPTRWPVVWTTLHSAQLSVQETGAWTALQEVAGLYFESSTSLHP